MQTTESIIELIEKYGPQMQLPGQFLHRWCIRNEQMLGAIQSYARGVCPDAIIGMVDDSFKNDGSEGLLFTTSGIYFSRVATDKGKAGHSYLRYVDITEVNYKKAGFSDHSSKLQIYVKNLPVNYYEVSNTTINKTPFQNLLKDIQRVFESNESYESDRVSSVTNVRHYYKLKNSYFREIVSHIEKGEIIKDNYVWVTDGIGLTPLHYCIIYQDEKNFYKILKKTLKYNMDMYLLRQPYGIYNYCMAITAIADPVTKSDVYTRLFIDLYSSTPDIKKIDKQIKREKFKEGVSNIVTSIDSQLQSQADRMNEQAYRNSEENRQKLESAIDRQVSETERLKAEGKYTQWVSAREKLNELNEQYDGMYPSDDDSYYEVEGDNEDYSYEVEDTGDYINDNRTPAEAAEDELSARIEEYASECSSKLKEAFHDKASDPRTNLIVTSYRRKDLIKERLNSEDNVLIEVRYKQFLVPASYMEQFPELKEFIVEET